MVYGFWLIGRLVDWLVFQNRFSPWLTWIRFVDQTGLKLTDIYWPLPPRAGIKGMHHRAQLVWMYFFYYVNNETPHLRFTQYS